MSNHGTSDAIHERLVRLERLETELREVKRQLERINNSYRRLLEPKPSIRAGRS